jgi:hypothetical protein
MISYWLYHGTTQTGKEMITTSSAAVYISPHILGSVSVSGYCIFFATCYEYEWFDVGAGPAFTTAMTVFVSWLASVVLISLPIIAALRYSKRTKERSLAMVRFRAYSNGKDNTPLLQCTFRC